VRWLVPRHRPGWQALAGGKRAHAGAAATPVTATVTRGGDVHAIFMGGLASDWLLAGLDCR
jgi:hypothetical protein